MELSEIQLYLMLIVGSGAAFTTVMSGARYFYNKYVKDRDERLVKKICIVIEPHAKRVTALEDRLGKFETRFDDLWRFIEKRI